MNERMSLAPGWSTEGLPESIVQEFHRLAQQVICTRFVPMIWVRYRRQKRKVFSTMRRQVYTNSQLADVLTSQSDFFRSWPPALLKQFVLEAAEVQSFNHQDIVVHGGESSSSAMVFLLGGSCELFPRSSAAAEDIMSNGAGRVIFNFQGASAATRLLRKSSAEEKSGKGLWRCPASGVVRAPFCLGDFATINREPWLFYAISEGSCDCLVLPAEAVFRFMTKLDPILHHNLLARAAVKRCEHIPLCHPMSERGIRMSPLLKDLPVEGVNSLIPRLVPRVVAKGNLLCEKGKFCHEMYFLRRGIAAYNNDDNDDESNNGSLNLSSSHRSARFHSFSSSLRKGIVVLEPGACLGERELIFRERFPHSVVAETTLDLLVLRYHDLDTLRSSSEECRSAIDNAASTQREKDLTDLMSTGAELRDIVAQIPLLSYFATLEDIIALAQLLHPRVFNSHQMIVSSTDPCDRLLMLTRGAAQVRPSIRSSSTIRMPPKPTPPPGNSSPTKGASTPGPVPRKPSPTSSEQVPTEVPALYKNECIGYTCLLMHRWEHTIVAVEPVDLWEITREEYYNFLKERRLYNKVLSATIQLVQPLYPVSEHLKIPELFQLAVQPPRPNTFPYLRTPNMHPVEFECRHLVYAMWAPRSFSSEGDGTEVGPDGLRPKTPRRIIMPHATSTKVSSSPSPPPDQKNKKKDRGTGVILSTVSAPQRLPHQVTLHGRSKLDLSDLVTVDSWGNLMASRISFKQSGKNSKGLPDSELAVKENGSSQSDDDTEGDDEAWRSDGAKEASTSEKTAEARKEDNPLPRSCSFRNRGKRKMSWQSHTEGNGEQEDGAMDSSNGAPQGTDADGAGAIGSRAERLLVQRENRSNPRYTQVMNTVAQHEAALDKQDRIDKQRRAARPSSAPARKRKDTPTGKNPSPERKTVPGDPREERVQPATARKPPTRPMSARCPSTKKAERSGRENYHTYYMPSRFTPLPLPRTPLKPKRRPLSARHNPSEQSPRPPDHKEHQKPTPLYSKAYAPMFVKHFSSPSDMVGSLMDRMATMSSTPRRHAGRFADVFATIIPFEGPLSGNEDNTTRSKAADSENRKATTSTASKPSPRLRKKGNGHFARASTQQQSSSEAAAPTPVDIMSSSEFKSSTGPPLLNYDEGV